MSDIQGVTGAVNEVALRALMERTGYPIEQKPGTGQRIYGPPPAGHPLRESGQPSRGCEIFVGRLPRNCFEDELVQVLERCGPLYELRMMMDFTGVNRGFCFATYANSECARRAVNELNNFEIRPGCHIGVCRSVDNCRLFLGGIPRDKQRHEILEAISLLVPHVKDVIVKPDPKEKQKNRGFAFVEFESHHAAAMARRKLANKKTRMWDQEIAVDWAEPEPEIDQDIMAKVKVLYFYNLMLTTSEQAIEKLCCNILGKVGAVERVKKLKDYAFVHFKEREDAIKVIEEMDGKLFEGSIIQITLAKPPEKKPQPRNTQPLPTPGIIVTPGGAILFQQGIGASAIVSSREACPRNPLVMGVKDGNKSRVRGAGGIGKVYSRSSSAKKTNPDLKLAPLNDLVATNQVILSTAQVKSTTQALEEACRIRGLGPPQYEVTSTTGADGDPLFVSRVSLHSLNITFTGNRACKVKEDSYENAAYAALKTIEEKLPLVPTFVPQIYPVILPNMPQNPASPSFLTSVPINPVVMDRLPQEFFTSAPYIPANASQFLVTPPAVMIRPPVDGQIEMPNNFNVYSMVANSYILSTIDDAVNPAYGINQAGIIPFANVPQPYNFLPSFVSQFPTPTLQAPVTNNA